MNETIEFETFRLRLRPWRDADREPFAALNAGPVVMGHFPAPIVSFTTVENRRSRAVMERIGMHDAHEDFEHPGITEGHRQRPHCLYRLTPQQWQAHGA